MGYAIIRTNKISSISAINGVLRHNQRKVQVPSANPNIKNPKLIFPQIEENQKLGSYAKFLKSRIKPDGRRIRKDAVRGVEVLMSFSKGSITQDELKDWVKDSVSFCADFFGGWENIYDIQLHVDEEAATEHLHALILPCKDGKLKCTEYLGGKEKMQNLQTQYAERMKKYGLERGKSKEFTRAVHKNSVDYHLENNRNFIEHEAYKEMFGEPLNWNLEKRMEFYNIVDKIDKSVNPPKNKNIKLNIERD